MDDPFGTEPDPLWHRDIRMSLGLLALGALSDGERSVVRHHLAECPACLARSAEFAQVIGALSMVTEEDARAIVNEFGAFVPGGPASGARRRPRRPSAALVGAGGLLMAVALAVGLLIGAQLQTGVPAPPAAVSMSVTGDDIRTGVSLSVFVTGRGEGVSLNATVAGLPNGLKYQLYAVTGEGRTYVVGRWVSSSQVQTVTADLPVPASALAFFTVTRQDGAPVVSAQILHTGQSMQTGPSSPG